MDNPSSDFEELLAAFNANRVKAIIVGGHALAFHGRPRFTKDLITAIDGVTFDEAWAGRAQGRFGRELANFLGREEFLRNKRASGRQQDLADIDAIE